MTGTSKSIQINHRSPSQASSSKPPKPTVVSNVGANEKSLLNLDTNPSNLAMRSPISLSPQDQYLSHSTHLTRHELIQRRRHNLKQLEKCYRSYYWALMEDLRAQYREYYWTYGVSPYKEDQIHDTPHRRSDNGAEFMNGEGGSDGQDGLMNAEEDVGENMNENGASGGSFDNRRCSHVGCKVKAMPLTSYCFAHILSDAKQKLYKPCGYVIKSAQAGNITCGKPILCAMNPPFCALHFQKAQKHVLRALKKAGLTIAPSGKHAPKLHVVIAEYVHQIQSKRRAVKRANSNRVAEKDTDDTITPEI